MRQPVENAVTHRIRLRIILNKYFVTSDFIRTPVVKSLNEPDIHEGYDPVVVFNTCFKDTSHHQGSYSFGAVSLYKISK